MSKMIDQSYCRATTGTKKRHAAGFLCAAIAVYLFFGGTECIIAAPAQTGNMRLSVHGQISNGYIIDSNRFHSIAAPFAITIREYDNRRATSAAHFLTLGLFTHLEYRAHPHISVGIRTGVDVAPVHAFYVSDLRIPLLATVGFVIADSFTVQPELGLTINYAAIAEQAGANVEAGLRLRFFDRFDLYGAFLHGTLSGFSFSVSVRFFSIFDLPLGVQSS